MKRVLVAAALVSIVALQTSAEYARKYSPLDGSVQGVASLSNGGAVVLSSSNGFTLFTTDASGNVVNGRRLDFQPWFVVTGPGDSIFVGGAQLSLSDGPELRLAKLNAKLEVVWTSRYVPSSGRSYLPYSASVTPDGGLLIGGAEIEAGAFVVRLAADGAVKWARRVDSSGREAVRKVIPTRDGGVLCAGQSRSSPWLAKLNANGELEWQQLFMQAPGGLDGVVETGDGDFVAAGSSLFLVRTTSKGVMKWLKAIKVGESVESSLISLKNDSFVLSAQLNKSSLLLGFRGDGTQLWQETFIPAADHTFTHISLRGAALAPAPAGFFYAPSLRETNLLFRIDENGKTGCPWFSPSSQPLEEIPLRPESLPSQFEPVGFEKQPWNANPSEATLTASPFACSVTAAPVAASAVAPSRASGFDRDAALNEKRRLWQELLRKKDFAQLETVAAQLRAKPWSSDPLHWDIGRFYEALGSPYAEMTPLLREWMTARPKSITPQIALAQAAYSEGWKYRGEGFTNTVTDADMKMFEKLLGESEQTLSSVRDAETDPHYWQLLVQIVRNTGSEDPIAVARRAAKYTSNPDVFSHAVIALVPQWGDRLDELHPFAVEVAALTKSTMGDAMYTWMAYQAQFQLGAKEAAKLGFDWPRVRQGARDLIRLSPEWIPTYHRLALMAWLANDRETAREMFQRKELDWYDAATSMWSRVSYEEARDWALRTPAAPPATVPATKLKQAPAAPPATVPATKLKQAPAAPPATAPVTKLKQAPAAEPTPLTSRPFAQWPQIVMQNKLIVDGVAQPPRASFLVQTSAGVVAVSAVPGGIESTRTHMTKWTMAAPAKPKSILTVRTIDTSTPEFQLGVALTLAPVRGSLPVSVLKLYPPEQPPDKVFRVFVVACRWVAGRCNQAVFEARVLSRDYSTDKTRMTYSLKLEERFDPETLTGAAVLNEDGYAMAVLDGRSSAAGSDGAYYDAEDLRMVVKR